MNTCDISELGRETTRPCNGGNSEVYERIREETKAVSGFPQDPVLRCQLFSRKNYVPTEVDISVFDPIILLITIVFLDDVFEAEITSVEDGFYMQVGASRRSLEFRRVKTPIFRQAERTANGIETLSIQALRYYTCLHYLQRPNLQAEFLQILDACAIRRGTDEAVEGK